MRRAVLILALVDLPVVVALTALDVYTLLNPGASHNPWGNPLGQAGFVVTFALGVLSLVLGLTVIIMAMALAAREQRRGWYVVLLFALLVALFGPSASNAVLVGSAASTAFVLALVALPLVLPLAALIFVLRSPAPSQSH